MFFLSPQSLKKITNPLKMSDIKDNFIKYREQLFSKLKGESAMEEPNYNYNIYIYIYYKEI